jgi:hypothetical protein
LACSCDIHIHLFYLLRTLQTKRYLSTVSSSISVWDHCGQET